MKILLFLLSLTCFSLSVKADEITHQLGNSGYAVRWAMQWGADYLSPTHYWNSVHLQRKARLSFAASDYDKALEYSHQAEAEAKQALEDIKSK